MRIWELPSTSLVGKCLRLPFRLIPKSTVVPILAGPLRGKKWAVGASNHSCWLGLYEVDKCGVFVDTVNSGATVYDIGAQAGYYTLLASELVGQAGRVIAFEPLPANIDYLKQHIQLNQLSNVTVVESAVSDCSGLASFRYTWTRMTAQLSSTGNLTVKKVSLDEMIAAGTIPRPTHMKIDVEGGELDVLQGARQMLSQWHPTIFLATHGPVIHFKCIKFLMALDYEFKPIGGAPIYKANELLVYV